MSRNACDGVIFPQGNSLHSLTIILKHNRGLVSEWPSFVQHAWICVLCFLSASPAAWGWGRLSSSLYCAYRNRIEPLWPVTYGIMHGPLSKGLLPFSPSASAWENKPASVETGKERQHNSSPCSWGQKTMREKITMHPNRGIKTLFTNGRISQGIAFAQHILSHTQAEIVADDRFCLSNSITQHGTSKISHETVNRKTFIIRHVWVHSLFKD